MSSFLPVKYILVDFLRHRLTDPRARAEGTNTETFTATASQTEFELTPTTGSVSCITSVKVDDVAQSKWEDYWIDFRDQKVIFFNALSEDDEVEITYKQGTTNWIYWDKPRTDLSDTSFPRINILIVSGNGVRLGQYNSDVESSILFQIDIWAKESKTTQIFTIDGRKYAGEELAEYISSKITEAFEDYESDLHPCLYSYENNQIARDLPFDDETQCHHKELDITLNGLAINRVD